MMTKTNIPWAFLKETPEGKIGIIPGVGFRFAHRKMPMRVPVIVVDLGTGPDWPGRAMLRIIRDQSLKSGWSRPHLVAYDERMFNA